VWRDERCFRSPAEGATGVIGILSMTISSVRGCILKFVCGFECHIDEVGCKLRLGGRGRSNLADDSTGNAMTGPTEWSPWDFGSEPLVWPVGAWPAELVGVA
jgi:hypothetical protein